MAYRFGDLDISPQQFQSLQEIAQMGSLGLLDKNSGNKAIMSTLTSKPSGFQAQLAEYMGDGQQAQAPQYAQLGIRPELLSGPTPNQYGQSAPMPEEEGNFGFGGGRGELFGEGGFAQTITKPFRGLGQSLMDTGFGLGSIAGTGAQQFMDTDQGIANLGRSLVQYGKLGNDDALKIAQGQLDDDLRNRIWETANQLNLGDRAVLGADASLKNISQGLSNAPVIGQGNPNLLTSDQERREYWDNPLLGGVKQGAGIGAFAVPGGGGTLAQAAGRGALGGALGGFGASETGQEVQGALSGGAFGGLLGGAAFGGGQLLNKARNRGAAPVQQNMLSTVDEGIGTKIGDLREQGLGIDDINYKTGIGTGTSNARLNYITQNLQGDDQAIALKELADSLGQKSVKSATDKTVLGQIENIYGVKPGGNNPLSKLGRRLEEGGLRVKADKFSPTGIQDAAQLKSDVAGLLREQGIKRLDGVGIGESYNKLNAQLGKVLEESTSPVDSMNVLTKFTENLSDKGLGGNLTGSQQQIQDRLLLQLNRVNTAKDLAGFKKTLQDSIGSGTFDAARSGARALSPVEEVKLGMFAAVDNTLKNEIPEVAPIYANMSKLYQVAPETVSKLDKGFSLGSPLVANVKLPLGDIPVRLQQTAGRLLQGLGGGTGRLGGGAPIVNNMLTRAIPAYAGMDQGQRAGQEVAPMLPEQSLDVNMGEQLGMAQATGGNQDGLNQLLAQGVLSGEIGAADAKYLSELLGGGGGAQKKMTEKQSLFGGAANQAQGALDLLETGDVRIGKLGNLANNVEAFFGSSSPKSTDFRAKLASARSAAISALSGANVPASEYARMANMIPEDTDEPAVAKQKLKSFISYMNNLAGQQVQQPIISNQQSMY